ncbi:MAG: tRNA (adenosine(37)-N6)-threonylcarbamoyltransferase complex ATPase subunit type 1 TsaE [Chloroflexi bacterium]|nr:tRNA (adenosine(37)-N6)-threonylcarbamoyltransferase complex ATPase subunit type 1 TsaE [Chloroflexota bacterium]
MNSLELTTRSPEQTQEFGTRLGKIARPGDVILLVGKLGAGKTCLTQGIAWGLGIKEYAASPSFVLVRELKGRLPLYHLDFYRLENLAEIAELGLDEYFYGRGVSVVEWAEKALSLLPPENLLIEMEYISETGRRLKLKPSGKRYREMVARLK